MNIVAESEAHRLTTATTQSEQLKPPTVREGTHSLTFIPPGTSPLEIATFRRDDRDIENTGIGATSPELAPGPRVGDRLPQPAVCRLVGYRVPQAIRDTLDQYFSEVDLSEVGKLRFTLNAGVSPLEALRALDKVNIKLHRGSLFPSKELLSTIPEIERSLSAAWYAAVSIAVEGTEQKDRHEMSTHLASNNMHLAPRLAAVLALNLNLLLRGENGLADKHELRDAVGSLFATMSGMHSHQSSEEPMVKHQKLSAIGAEPLVQ